MKSLDADYFSKIYERSDDPWNFETSWYEKRKYALTLASLPRATYARAFEPGSSFGVLSELLAPRCESLICYETVPAVAERARQRLARFPHVRVEPLTIPQDWPDAALDLIVLSEVVYYLSETALARLLGNVSRTLRPSGHVVAVHYREKTDYPMSGDETHERLAQGLERTKNVGAWLEPSFRVDVFERTGP
jgi:SAM-dependent methyltransferase